MPDEIIDKKKILLSHGSGGTAMHSLIRKLFKEKFNNEILDELTDSAVLSPSGESKLCFTTDSYVVNPIFFPGGDIGKLAIYGTINDLAVMGAKPLYLSCSFIIEEGLDYKTLERITDSMAGAEKETGVMIVTGDTKVVEKGSADKVFINTSGLGIIQEGIDITRKRIGIEDRILINGSLGEHGLSVMAAREEFETDIESDCAPLWHLIKSILPVGDIKFMRDPTRGGLATTLNEIVEDSDFGISISEDKIPIKDEVNALCEILGFDPLYLANEGKVVIITSKDTADSVLHQMQKHPLGRDACIIGEITRENKGRVSLKTSIGGTRIIDMLTGDQLPRIC